MLEGDGSGGCWVGAVLEVQLVRGDGVLVWVGGWCCVSRCVSVCSVVIGIGKRRME